MNGTDLASTVLAATSSSSGGSALSALLPLILLGAAFYFLVIRPTRNRQRQATSLQSRLQVGQQVMTTSGMYGRIEALEDDVVVLEPSPGVSLRFARAAVSRVLTPPAEQAMEDGDNGSDSPGS